jgi:hypothetical protein
LPPKKTKTPSNPTIPERFAHYTIRNYLLVPGGLFPLPPPEGLPVVLGPFGGRTDDEVLLMVFCFIVSTKVRRIKVNWIAPTEIQKGTY